MRFVFLAPALYVLFFLVSCSNLDTLTHNAVAREYCDDYFIYTMCVKDITGNSEIDLMYFTDTNDVFMLVNDIDEYTKSTLQLHKCVQIMDEHIRTVGSKLLYINADTPVLLKTRLKSRLILAYTHYREKINNCHKPEFATPSIDNEFGEEDFNEL